MSRIIRLVVSCVASITSILIPVIVAGFLFGFVANITEMSSSSMYIFDLQKFTDMMSAWNPGYSFRVAFESASKSMFWVQYFNDAVTWVTNFYSGFSGFATFIVALINLGNFGVTVALAIIPISVFATTFLVDIVNGVQFILTCIASPSIFFTDAASWVVY